MGSFRMRLLLLSTLDGWSRLLPGTAGCPAHSGSPFFIIFAAAACFFRKKYLLPASIGLMLILLIQFLLRAPSNDRDWNPSCARPSLCGVPDS